MLKIMGLFMNNITDKLKLCRRWTWGRRGTAHNTEWWTVELVAKKKTRARERSVEKIIYLQAS